MEITLFILYLLIGLGLGLIASKNSEYLTLEEKIQNTIVLLAFWPIAIMLLIVRMVLRKGRE